MATDTPAKKATAKAPAKEKGTRKMLTPAEKVAKLEAELAAARAKADEKAGAERKSLTEKKDKLTAKIADLNKQVADIDKQLESLGDGTTPDPDPIVSDQAAASS